MSGTLILLVAAATLACPLSSPGVPPSAPRPDNLPVGRWSVEFANGVKEACEIRKDGTASVVEPLRSSAGKVEVKDGSVVLAFQDDRIERWTPVGARMVVEHWAASAQFPSGTPVFGIGEVAGTGQVKKTDADYATVLRRVHAGLEAPHVIQIAHVKEAIRALAKEGQAITPYLLHVLREGSKQGATKEHGGGWPLWALVCGTLSEVGGEEGRAELTKVLADPATAKTVRYGADRAAEALGKNIKGQDEPR
jgi:hypothetical protein